MKIEIKGDFTRLEINGTKVASNLPLHGSGFNGSNVVDIGRNTSGEGDHLD